MNRAFAEKAIARAQRLSVESVFCQAITEFLMANKLVGYSPKYDLFLVNHPSQGWMPAVWMMPLLRGQA